MPEIRTEITVSKCSACPFFERGAISIAADFLAKRTQQSGLCKFNGMGQPFPIGRKQISDADAIPAGCPLEQGEAVVRIRRPS